MSIKLIQLALAALKNTKPKIVVIGDLILDEYLVGYPERISREAPVLILEHKENFFRLGGAANAAINAASLGAEVTLIGSAGQDEAAVSLNKICKESGISLRTILTSNKPTTLKTRILATNQSSTLSQAGTSQSQQVLRIDRQNKSSLNPNQETELLKIIAEEIKNADCVLMSDYALGVLTDSVIKETIKKHPKVVVDPSSSFAKFSGAFLFTPNEPDTEKELKDKVDFSSSASSSASFKKLQNLFRQNQQNLLITRGAEGMALVENNTIHLIPAFNKAEVFDVTGAGDTVSACICFGIANKLSLVESCLLGNLAASIVVRKAGAATTNLEELTKALDNLAKFEIVEHKV